MDGRGGIDRSLADDVDVPRLNAPVEAASSTSR
jgi:hypothetical protein